jgi:hypothetical protein
VRPKNGAGPEETQLPATVQEASIREQVIAFLRDLNLPLQQFIRGADLPKYCGLHKT